ncbi:Protein of unknown function [Pyronema omphalodes CBS 100304]|uniref:Uncharacterized protein n=1 Tax=Pyronema omphalodes (strain CBS 100304) TaxID=1076935 RepID=U4LFB1_PYROM|nr:Protein of unknown function [Pyronema omphalodes CBS 100304]
MGGNLEPEGAGMTAMPVLEEAGNGIPLIVVLLDDVPVPMGSAGISAEFDGRIPLDTGMKDPEADGTTTDLETDPVALTRLLVDAPSAEETGSGLAVVMTGTLNVTSVGEAPQPVLQVATVVVMITVIVDGVKVTGTAVVMWVVAVEIPTQFISPGRRWICTYVLTFRAESLVLSLDNRGVDSLSRLGLRSVDGCYAHLRLGGHERHKTGEYKRFHDSVHATGSERKTSSLEKECHATLRVRKRMKKT